MTLEESCKHLLQRSIKITLNRGKLLRRGTLILFNTKDHVITFTIKTHKGALRTYEMYYPYDVTVDQRKKEVILDYSLDSLGIDSHMSKCLRKKYRQHAASFDDQLVIEYE